MIPEKCMYLSKQGVIASDIYRNKNETTSKHFIADAFKKKARNISCELNKHTTSKQQVLHTFISSIHI